MLYFFNRFIEILRDIPRWLRPGLGVKRWLLFVMAGITLIGLGIAVVLIDIYRTNTTDPVVLT
ncbi:MAG TPA: hypothetical protein PKJ84_12385, partial [Anaerolineales bacterium]|nr:hypothetical protein [Anaerolineales bacterium]